MERILISWRDFGKILNHEIIGHSTVITQITSIVCFKNNFCVYIDIDEGNTGLKQHEYSYSYSYLLNALYKEIYIPESIKNNISVFQIDNNNQGYVEVILSEKEHNKMLFLHGQVAPCVMHTSTLEELKIRATKRTSPKRIGDMYEYLSSEID